MFKRVSYITRKLRSLKIYLAGIKCSSIELHFWEKLPNLVPAKRLEIIELQNLTRLIWFYAILYV